MKKCLYIFLGFFFGSVRAVDWAVLTTVDVTSEQRELLCPKKSVTFEKKLPLKATQLLFSWNMVRPQKGYFDFYMKVRNAQNKEWGHWVQVASWGSDRQRSYGKKLPGEPSFHYVRWEAKHGITLDRCKIKVVAQDGASLDALFRLAVAAIDLSSFRSQQSHAYHISLPSIQIRGVPLFSQMRVNHPEKNRICSPTSLAMVVSYLNRKKESIIPFLSGVYDVGLDTFGSWPFNSAHAFNQTGTRFYFSVTRLTSFEELYRYLARNLPVTVSIRGPLRTMPAGKTYAEGHLLVVVGWDNKHKRVICHDPAFVTNKEVLHTYDIKDFLRVWEKSKRLAYVAEPRVR